MRVSLSIQSCSRSEQRSPACSVSVSDPLFCEAYSCLFILWKRFVFRDFLHSFSSYFKFTMSKQEWSLWGQQWGFLHRKIKKNQANQTVLWLAPARFGLQRVMSWSPQRFWLGLATCLLVSGSLRWLLMTSMGCIQAVLFVSRWVGSAVQHPSCCHSTSSHGLGFAFWPLPERAETL